MATATKAVRTVTTGVTLELDNAEAQVLADILARIAGSTTHSRRGLASAIADALTDAGFKMGPAKDISDVHGGSLTFLSSEEEVDDTPVCGCA